MLKKLTSSFTRRTTKHDNWADWSRLPADYADAPRELRNIRRVEDNLSLHRPMLPF